jgi:hypothetical protein
VSYNNQRSTLASQCINLLGKVLVVAAPAGNVATRPLGATMTTEIPGDRPPPSLRKGACRLDVARRVFANAVPEKEVADRCGGRSVDTPIEQ